MNRSILNTRPHPTLLGALAVSAATVLPGAVSAQTKPPIATYWMSVETTSGIPMGGAGGGPSMMDIGRMMLGAGGGAQRQITLQLGSQQAAGGTPSAEHVIPPGLNMGAALPLESPRRAPPERREGEVPQGLERPKGRMLIFWGCGEKAGPGQPVIIDFANVAAGQWPAELFSRRVLLPQPPSPERSKTYGDWPNERDATRVPGDARLAGEHVIKGNYSPQIRFELADKYEFMEPVTFMGMNKSPGGGLRVIWKGVPNALGYFAGVMGSKGSGDLIWWTSSETREFGESLFSFVPPAEVNKLIRERVIMPPTTTECTVPAEVTAAAPAGMLRFVAYGEEVNFAHPPRPHDPKAPWNPEWAAKVRLKSTATTMIGEGMERTPGAAAEPQEPGTGEPVREGVGKRLKGLLGF